jgi:hypothetical protein
MTTQHLRRHRAAVPVADADVVRAHGVAIGQTVQRLHELLLLPIDLAAAPGVSLIDYFFLEHFVGVRVEAEGLQLAALLLPSRHYLIEPFRQRRSRRVLLYRDRPTIRSGQLDPSDAIPAQHRSIERAWLQLPADTRGCPACPEYGQVVQLRPPRPREADQCASASA